MQALFFKRRGARRKRPRRFLGDRDRDRDDELSSRARPMARLRVDGV
jgi:hypothetical protein